MHSARFVRLLGLALLMLAIPAASFAGVFVSVTVAPPPLPVYVQPVCPQPGYMWTPGYWAWADEGYYWVPGTWVPAPAVGMLWTPGYWGFVGGYYRWNVGYWGPHIGFYGGVNYGYGYGGVGFVGGEWRGGGFYYNRAVVNVNNTHITNVYVNKTVVVNNTTVNHVSYNGGTGGIHREPTAIEQQAVRENHIQPSREQSQHETFASQNKQLFAKNNGGKPAIAATAKPADFSSRNVVPANAAGGRVEPATLNASARTIPTTAKTAAVAPRSPSTNAGAGASSARDNRNVNVPKPPSTYTRSSTPNAPANRGANQTVPRPPANSPATRSPGNSGSNANYTRSQPQMHSNPPRADSRPPAPAPRVQNPAPRPSQPARPSSPPPQQKEKTTAANQHDKR